MIFLLFTSKYWKFLFIDAHKHPNRPTWPTQQTRAIQKGASGQNEVVAEEAMGSGLPGGLPVGGSETALEGAVAGLAWSLPCIPRKTLFRRPAMVQRRRRRVGQVQG